MNVFKYAPDMEMYETFFLGNADIRKSLLFSDVRRRQSEWNLCTIQIDEDGEKGDFPGLAGGLPVFSERAWDKLQYLLVDAVEPLPILHPDGTRYYLLNVLDVTNCIDLQKSSIVRNVVTKMVSTISRYVFNSSLIDEKNMFKSVETRSLEVYVSQTFKEAMERELLVGLSLIKIG